MLAINTIAARAGLTCAGALFCCQFAWGALPVQRWTQPSGAQVYLVESGAVPIVDAQVDFDAGSRRDPAGKAGLARATASLSGKGVRGDGVEPPLDENALDDAWADLGARFGATASGDRMSFTLRSLADPALLERAALLASRQIGQPTLAAAAWRDEQQRTIASLRESDTRPATLAARTYAAAIYGNHPYGQRPTTDTVAAITVADMQTLQRTELMPCGSKVSIVGAIDRAGADRLAAQLLSRLQDRGCAALPPIPEVAALEAARDIRLPFPAAQAQVLIGQPGIRRADPDYFPLLVGNYILGGGGFVSRLTEQVRERRGLSYSVYSAFDPGLHAGAFTVGLQTRPDQAAQAVSVATGVLDGFVADGPTAQELKAAQDNLVGGFPLRIDSNAKLLGNLASMAWNDLPLDYLDTWTDRIRRVSSTDIRAAFARVVRPGRLVTVVVGGAP